MNVQQRINYWKKGAEDAIDTAEKLMESKKYHHALFFCHLAIEKALKGVVLIYTQKNAIPIHNLIKLAKDSNWQFSEDQKNNLPKLTHLTYELDMMNINMLFIKKPQKNMLPNGLLSLRNYYNVSTNITTNNKKNNTEI